MITMNCPRCDAEMKVTELRCPECQIKISGEFAGCPFCGLEPGQIEFLKVFLRCEGNISRVGQVLGISYPKIKREFEDLLKRLKLTRLEDQEDILDSLEKGTISVDEAVELLRRRRRR